MAGGMGLAHPVSHRPDYRTRSPALQLNPLLYKISAPMILVIGCIVCPPASADTLNPANPVVDIKRWHSIP